VDLLISPPEAARRVRAALAYAGTSHADISKATGITAGTLRNMTSHSRPSGGSLDRLYLIAEACGVPRWFMEHGFDGATSRGANGGRPEPTVPAFPGERPSDDEDQRHAG